MSSIKGMLAGIEELPHSFEDLISTPVDEDEEVEVDSFSKIVNSDRMKGISFYEKPIDGEKIEGTPFYKNVLNLVYAPSGAGKTMTVAKLLLDSDVANKSIVWLDADHNVNNELVSILGQFNHVNQNVIKWANEIRRSKCITADTVVIFDSLKDFADKDDLDTNVGSQRVMQKLRSMIDTSATVIVLAHATATEDGFKIKGNQDTIESKSDVVCMLTTHKSMRIFTHTKNRRGEKSIFEVGEEVTSVYPVEEKATDESSVIGKKKKNIA